MTLLDPDRRTVLATGAAAAMSFHGANGLADVNGKIGRRRRHVAKSGKGERYGVVPVRDEKFGYFLESPTALPSAGNQDEGRHI